MPKFSPSSEQKKTTLHPDLQIVMDEAILHYDFIILCGGRPVNEQFELYKQGRQLVEGNWIISDKSKIVTYCDGTTNASKHNAVPSLAVDVAPYPLDWDDNISFALLVGKILEIARRLKDEGYINCKIISGADWNNNGKSDDEKFTDLPHIEIVYE